MTTTSRSGARDTSAASGTSAAWKLLYLIAAMRGITFFGDIAAATAIELSLQGRGYGGLAVASVLLAATIPPILLGPFAGRIVDRYSRPTVLATAASGQLLLAIGTLLTENPAIWAILIFGMGCGVAFAHPAFGSLPSVLLPRDAQPRAASISQMSAMAGMLSAPAAGAFTSASLGTRGSLALNVLAFTLVLLGALCLGRKMAAQNASDGPEQSAAADLIDHTYSVWRDRSMLALLISSGVLMLCASTINVFVVFYVRGTLQASTAMYGIVGSAWMAGLIPGALLTSKLPLPAERLLVGSFALVGLGILGTSFAPSVWWVLPCYFLGGLGNGAGATATHVLLNTTVPASHRGRAFSALGMVSNSGPTLGMLLGGVFLLVATPRTGYLIAGAAVLISLAIAARPLLAMRPERIEAPA